MPEKCPCKGDYLDKLIQPSILALLCEGPAYGLELLHELDRGGQRRVLPCAEEAGGDRKARVMLADRPQRETAQGVCAD